MSTSDVLPRRLATGSGHRVGTLAVLGDSAGAGLGDAVAGGRWRGVGSLLADALGVPDIVSTAVPGACVADVKQQQLHTACARAPDVAVVIAGMNDTFRADFEPREIATDLAAVVDALTVLGCTVLTVRYHDHTRLFRLPAPLRHAWHRRIQQLNDVIDEIAARPNVLCVDLGALPSAYDTASWSVDRLHPSELGHRLLARAFAEALASTGFAVAGEVRTSCSGGTPSIRTNRAWWLTTRGLPWLCRRTTDLTPHMVSLVARRLDSRARRALKHHLVRQTRAQA